MSKMDYNYHTHTWRCLHATGTEEEYIIRAIENGIRYMGFSDHVPFCCFDGFEAIGTRVPIAQVNDYVGDLNVLREKYKDKIEISIGFEMEYYQNEFDSMLSDARKWGAEYLILGQHFYEPEHPNGVHMSKPFDNTEVLNTYAKSLVDGMKTGVFTYVAHPDMVNFIGDEDTYCEIMRQVCITSRETAVPLEINFYGIRDNRNYPNKAFWKTVGEESAPVTFGFDAHNVASAFDGESFDAAMKLVCQYNLNYVGKPQLVRL